MISIAAAKKKTNGAKGKEDNKDDIEIQEENENPEEVAVSPATAEASASQAQPKAESKPQESKVQEEKKVEKPQGSTTITLKPQNSSEGGAPAVDASKFSK